MRLRLPPHCPHAAILADTTRGSALLSDPVMHKDQSNEANQLGTEPKCESHIPYHIVSQLSWLFAIAMEMEECT